MQKEVDKTQQSGYIPFMKLNKKLISQNPEAKSIKDIWLGRYINQDGVTYGERKLELMRKACKVMQVPMTNDQNDATNRLARVKMFDPTGSWSWFIIDWDGSDICFGLVEGCVAELGYFSLVELANTKGAMGLGIEIDVNFCVWEVR